MQKLPDLMTVQEAAGVLKVTPRTLINWGKQGRIKLVQIAQRGAIRVLTEDVVKLVARSRR